MTKVGIVLFSKLLLAKGKMFGLNLSALLDSLDNVAKETLEEPKESATEIRSKRKASSKVDIIAAESSSHDNTSTFDQGNDDSGVWVLFD